MFPPVPIAHWLRAELWGMLLLQCCGLPWVSRVSSYRQRNPWTKKVQIDAGWWTVQRNGGRAPTKSATINYYLHFKEEEIEK